MFGFERLTGTLLDRLTMGHLEIAKLTTAYLILNLSNTISFIVMKSRLAIGICDGIQRSSE